MDVPGAKFDVLNYFKPVRDFFLIFFKAALFHGGPSGRGTTSRGGFTTQTGLQGNYCFVQLDTKTFGCVDCWTHVTHELHEIIKILTMNAQDN